MFVLHMFPDSAALAVRLTLAELGLPFRLHEPDRTGEELDSPAYRAIHPLGKVPALETPDGPVFETAACLLWLADRHAPGRMCPAPDSPDRAAFLKWLFFTSTNLHTAVMDLHYPDRAADAATAPLVQAQARLRTVDCLAALEGAAAATPGLFTGAKAGILGLYISMLMRWLGSLPPDHPGHFTLAAYPALHGIAAALETRASVQEAARDEGLGPRPFTDPTA